MAGGRRRIRLRDDVFSMRSSPQTRPATSPASRGFLALDVVVCSPSSESRSSEQIWWAVRLYAAGAPPLREGEVLLRPLLVTLRQIVCPLPARRGIRHNASQYPVNGRRSGRCRDPATAAGGRL